ncbi:putative Core-2/I-branching beta-1,6-N-acetylglucosaminyltransferase family protein [Melia azedarach]|uniref:Core-2/I-branching beta-1,6-N-acetylglucosaminyltransferase family protein n=1 Tax=Melia azedarach TaxID=155640 RepID=A0ACC1X957_MELAZ|nr:putative Core-2/I-branching beta-1,6-N-acetylglucosaminyltransferase family protein [Melia azedarach]
MLSPSPLSLLCALLLCLPLAIVFTITTPTATTTPTSISQANESPATIFVPKPKPPPSIQIPKDDRSLFRVAARVVSPKPTSPKKLAFMFLTTLPLPLAPLWELYFNRTSKSLYNIYVHADPSFQYDPPFSGVFTGRVIPSKPSFRFTPTLISAARRLLAHALLHDPGNYMFALLSPSCIPIHSFNFTYKTLMSSEKSFIEILKNEPGTYDRWAARGQDAMLPEVKLEDFRIGSQFWVLTRKHARLVVSDERIWDKFNQRCKQEDTCYPEENYFPTLINMRDPRGCVPATLTHVDWSVSQGGHPREYKAWEVGPELILKLRNCRPRYGDDENMNGSDMPVMQRHDPFLFARKFSRGSIQPLLSIANEVIFKD